jgi:uptake hydrogenase large subunit
VGVEGELLVALRVRAGHVDDVRVMSSRPEVARALLQGRTRAEARAAVPLVFSVCGRSQAAANELASAAAAGEDVDAGMRARCADAVTAESVREGAWRTLLDWPRWLGETPGADCVAAARQALALHAGESAETATDAIARAAFGVSAAEWLALPSRAALDAWLDAGSTAAARFARRVRDDAPAPAGATDEPPLLAGSDHAAWVGDIASALDVDPAFAQQPTWRGAPAETGALARLQADPIVRKSLQAGAGRVEARFIARLRELALLLAGRVRASVGAMTLPQGGGLGWVENARGLLVHRVRLADGRVERYDIVAPTEWNFHPAGALRSALAGAPAGDRGALRERATRLVHSLDPCVACKVEVDGA